MMMMKMMMCQRGKYFRAILHGAKKSTCCVVNFERSNLGIVPFNHGTSRHPISPSPCVQSTTPCGAVLTYFRAILQGAQKSHVVLQTSSARISTNRDEAPLYRNTPQPRISPSSCVQRTAHAAPFRHSFNLFRRVHKIASCSKLT